MRGVSDRTRKSTGRRMGFLPRPGNAGCLVLVGCVLLQACGPSPSASEATEFETIARQVVTLGHDPTNSGPVYVALRSSGTLLVDAWTWPQEPGAGAAGETPSDDAVRLVTHALERCAHVLSRGTSFETAQISLTYDYVEVDPMDLYEADRGVLGVELVSPGIPAVRVAPSRMIAENLDWDDVLGTLRTGSGGPTAGAPSTRAESGGRDDLRVRAFRTSDFLVTFTPPMGPASPSPVEEPRHARQAVVRAMSRGNQVVPMTDVTRDRTEALALGLATWLGRNVHRDGRLTYKYWPSPARESDANNLVRQLLGNVCLERLARIQAATEQPPSTDARTASSPARTSWLDSVTLDFADLAARNLSYDLDRFYVGPGSVDDTSETDPHGGSEFGYLRYDGKVKLGAAALAGLAIHESSDPTRFATEAGALFRFTEAMRDDSGAFRTFYEPRDRNDCQNFYPGEALYYWARLLAADESWAIHRGFPLDREALAQRVRESLAFYQAWHLRNPNPAFVPWHTRASYLLWKESRDPALADWIFRMNDWLLGIQQWGDAPHADMAGRFYAPDRPYGPPHASSTGVYLEGLIDAFALARDLGEDIRAGRYRRAIWGGIRSAMQLQFEDETDLFYVRDRAAVEGALRTTVYDNEIRVDNVQHVLMALLDILTVFQEEDFPNPDLVAMRTDRD